MKLIPLTRGKFAKVDDSDFEALSAHCWYAWWHKNRRVFYAVRNERRGEGTQRQLRMHRVILNPASRAHVDHENGDGLDNQRHNLRGCTRSQNGGNRQKNRFRAGQATTSGFKGVSRVRDSARFRALIRRDGKPWHLGYFRVETDAARAYDRAALIVFGEFARLNFPENKNLTSGSQPVG